MDFKTKKNFKHQDGTDYQSRYSRVTLSKPHIIGYMSVNNDRQYQSNLSQLKYLREIPEGKLHYDLSHNINNAVKRTTDKSNEMISLLLQFLQDQRYNLNLQNKDIDFICYRRVLISIMCNAYDMVEPLLISTCFYNGSIYLCILDTPQEIIKRQFRSEAEQKFCAWGYKFEQYMLSDQPNTKPNIMRPVIENEEFFLFYYATLGSHNLIYGAQIDGMLTVNSAVPNPPETSNVECNVNYLRNKDYVELKTNKHIENYRQDRNFKRYKLLRCWCQCYLANLKGLLVGFRNEGGIVQNLQWFDTQDIVEYCKNEWHPQIAIDFLHHILCYIKHCFSKNKGTGPVSLNFQLNANKTIDVFENPDCVLLPQWYTNKGN